MMYAFAAMMGMCGTKWPGWWRGPKKPQPDPWWWIEIVIGAAAGIGASIVLKEVSDGSFLATAAIPFFGGATSALVLAGLGLGGKEVAG
ncbi:hypothetical protein [Sphingomonas caeni]|uniref:hypothetical protein n=1 Tax=Sphingomonas caeni TaxID=2984949 RepID=UPI0022322D20|nr:hypothetical protein [Sphingomonas caeni]